MTTKTRAKTRRIELAWVDHPDACFDHLIGLGWSDREATHAIGILALYGMGRDGAAAAHPNTMTKLRNALRDVATPTGQPPRIGRSFTPGSNETGRARLTLVGAITAASLALLSPAAVGSHPVHNVDPASHSYVNLDEERRRRRFSVDNRKAAA